MSVHECHGEPMREVTVLSNAKSRMTVLYECRVCHRAVEAVADVKRGAEEGTNRGRQTWRDVQAYQASLREPRPLPQRVEEEPEPEVEAKPRATPIRPAPRVRVTRRRDGG